MNGVEDTKNLENELIAKVETGIPDQQLDAMYFAKNAALHHKLSYGYCCDLAERIINRSQNFTPENWDSLAVAVKELDFKEQAAELVGGTIAANCTLRAFNHMLVWDMFKYKNLQKQIEEAEKEFDPLELVYPGENPVFEKYDQYVPEELVRKGFAYGVLDIEGMKKRVLGWDDPL